MTTSSATSRPEDLTERIIVAVAGALLLFVVAVVGFNVVDSWLLGLVVLVLIPVHAVLAITDTNILEEPLQAPARALAELKRLIPSASAGPYGGPSSGGAPFGGPTPGAAPFNGPPPGAAPPGFYGQGPAQSGGLAPGPSQFGPPPSGPASFNGPPTTGYMQPSGPVPQWSGHSYDPPGTHGPSVVHGFGSYGNRDTDQPAEPAPSAAQPAEPTTDLHRQDTESTDATSTSSAVRPPAPQWDEPDRDDDLDDPDMTIQRPPKNP